MAEIGPSDRLAEILRIKNSILTNEDPDAQYWEFLKMVNRPSMSGEISLDKRDDLDPINMEVVSEAEDSAFPTTSHQSFGHSQGEFYSSTNQLRQFSAVPVTKFNQPDSFKSSYQSGWTAPMVHSLMPNTFFMQNYQTFPPLPPPIRSTPPPPPPVAQWTQVSPEKVPIKNTTQTSGKLEADKEVADVIKKIFECSQLSEDEATVPPIMQLKSAQSTGSSKLSEKFDEAVEVEEKTIESESDNDEEVEALRALVIGTMCKKVIQEPVL